MREFSRVANLASYYDCSNPCRSRDFQKLGFSKTKFRFFKIFQGTIETVKKFEVPMSILRRCQVILKRFKSNF